MVAIFFILTILTLVAVDVLVSRRREAQAVPAPPAPIDARLADGLFLHPGHGWVQIDAGGLTQVGVDSFVRGVVGEPERVLARPVGTQVRQGEPMLTIERGGRHLQIPAPLSGRVEAVNPELEKHPTWWGQSAHDGWTYTLRPEKLGAEIEGLRVAEAAAGWLRGQTARLSEWLSERALVVGAAAPTLPDGGAPAEGALNALDESAWSDFERVFLPAGSEWSW